MASKQLKFNNHFMQLALSEAQLAFDQGEVPVGCVIVDPVRGAVIASAHNLCEQEKNANLHAEILAINEACKILDSKNLSDLDLYVTLEPCTMCASAIANSRIGRIYYGAADEKQGAVENGVRFFTSDSCFHRPEIYSGIKSQESEDLLKEFFKSIRR
jgi:tRNA(Arg) A34 adenosine deaminase TadA